MHSPLYFTKSYTICTEFIKEMLRINNFFTRVVVENHIDQTSYAIAYSSNEKITWEIIAERIRDDICKMMRLIRVDHNERNWQSAAKCELSTDGKTAILYSKDKAHGLWHTGATVALYIKNEQSTQPVVVVAKPYNTEDVEGDNTENVEGDNTENVEEIIPDDANERTLYYEKKLKQSTEAVDNSIRIYIDNLCAKAGLTDRFILALGDLSVESDEEKQFI
jgi:hypothetical protein